MHASPPLLRILFGSFLGLALGAACSGDDDDGPTDDGSTDDGSTDDGADDGADATTRFQVRIENVAPWTALKSGAQTTHTDGAGGPLSPGEAFEVTFTAGKGQNFSFAAMLGESNDWFFAPGPAGIALHEEDGQPRSGDVTAEVALWDAGTEVDQEPSVGPDTGPMQSGPDQGAADPVAAVRELDGTIELGGGDSFALPSVDDMIRVTVTAGEDSEFTVRVENVSTAGTLDTSTGSREIHVSPLVWALHIAPAPLFDVGEPDRGAGLERIAENGGTGDLASAMAALSGAHTPVSPGVYAVHAGGEPLYTDGSADRGLGLERIGEEGNVAPLAEALAASPPEGTSETGLFNTPVGADQPGAARPGAAFELEIEARPGERLSFAAMFGMSNDWVFATPAAGVALFDADGAPIDGDVSDEIVVVDVGTEIDQELAIGPFTGPQQAGPDMGPADPIGTVRAADYPIDAASHVRVTVTPV